MKRRPEKWGERPARDIAGIVKSTSSVFLVLSAATYTLNERQLEQMKIRNSRYFVSIPRNIFTRANIFSCCFFALKMLGTSLQESRGEMHFIPIHDSWPKSSAHRPPSLSIEGGSCSEVSDRVTNLALCTHQRKMGCLF